MCGRFSLVGDPFELGFKDNFNITPATSIPVKTINCDGQLMKWSYSPSWKPDMNLINCRSETIAEKPSFKGAKRCIIPFSGWYEWQKQKDAKVPYYHYSNAKYFAGIFNESGCCILTRVSANTLSHIHHRQPVLLQENEIGEYFMGQDIYDSSANYDVQFYEVSKQLNSPKNNFPSLTEEIC